MDEYKANKKKEMQEHLLHCFEDIIDENFENEEKKDEQA
jgi:hypothetical protein